MKKSFSIRSYLGFSHALLLTISLGAIGFIWSRNEYNVITGEMKSLMQERAKLLSTVISHEIAEYHQVKIDQTELPEFNLEGNLLAVYIDRNDEIFDLEPGSVTATEASQFIKFSHDHPVYKSSYAGLVITEHHINSIYAAAPVFDSHGEPIGTVCLLLPLGELDAYILRLRWLLIGAILVVTLLSIGVSTLLTRYFSKHFSNAQDLAATVAEGNYHLRIPESGPTELRDLSRYLNQMAEKLYGQVKARQTLLANVAHELARPLAGLQIGIESLRRGAIQNPDLADDLLVTMGQTVRRLGSLVDDITLAAHPQVSRIELDRQPIAVEPFLRGVATRFWGLAESRGIRIKVRVEAGLTTVYADERRITQILGNLMDNAIKFTSHGKTIQLSAESSDEHTLCITVHDGGDGISPAEASHLFEPFFQGDLGRKLKQGMGLGLAIARQLAQAHGGDLKLENHPKGGSLAILTLPKALA